MQSLDLNKYTHIIWDWNGTLLNDVDYCVDCMNHLLLEHELPILDKAKYQEVFTFPVEDYYKKLGFDFQKESFDVLGHRFMDYYAEKINNCQLQPKAIEVLQLFQEAGKRQFILSAMEHHSLKAMLKNRAIDSYFQAVYGIDNYLAAGKLGRAKTMLQENHFDLSKTLLIGDTLHDREVADQIGGEIIFVANGHQSRQRLEQNGVFVIEDLKALLKSKKG